MQSSTWIAMACLVAGVVGLGWYDRWHLLVGLPLLGLWQLGRWWWHTRAQAEEDGDMDATLDTDPEPGRALLVGLVHGGGLLLGLAAACAGLAGTPLEALVRGPECRETLAQLRLLADGQAYARILQLVDAQLRHPLGASCRNTVREQKVRALLGLAEHTPGPERVPLLDQARTEADALGQPDLVHLSASWQEAARQQQVVAHQDQQLRDHEAVIQQQHQEITRLHQDRDRFLTVLQAQHIPVQETTQGTLVRLTEAHTVLFTTGQATLTPAALAALHEVAALVNLPPYHTRRIRIEGHTDARGSDSVNQQLSADRAQRVQQVLVAQGVSPARLEVVGYGRSHPIANNDTASGRAHNRRVDLLIAPAEPQ